MKVYILKIFKRTLLFILFIAIVLFVTRVYLTMGAPSLQLWHTYVPKELNIKELKSATWQDYISHEEKIFQDVRKNVTEKLPNEQKTSINRYYNGSIVYPDNLIENWNKSYILTTREKPIGAVVFLHGLTDSPYSLRHLSKRYNEEGYVSIGIRLPGHGTVPSGLSHVQWEEWMEATKLAIREAKRLTSPKSPLHIVGFSNGGALAVKYSLDALEDSSLAMPDRIILISPMIGVTRFAKFAGLMGIPAHFPAFERASWLGIVPEFNPFKYNSFPVNGGRQSHRLTVALQEQILNLKRNGKIENIPPILTFQSAIDFTVSTPAIISALYANLPDNGSELVLFDINQATAFRSLMRSNYANLLTRLTPELPQKYDLTLITNTTQNDISMIERKAHSGSSVFENLNLNLTYPIQIFSLSHVALPFPMNDPLYGMTPEPGSYKEFGLNLGAISARGERGALLINLDSLFRISSNPFFPYMLEKFEDKMKNPIEAKRTPKEIIYASPLPNIDTKEYEKLMSENFEESLNP